MINSVYEEKISMDEALEEIEKTIKSNKKYKEEYNIKRLNNEDIKEVISIIEDKIIYN